MTDYALRVSDEEIGRYRWMADRARSSEAELWTTAGIVPGAVVADVGCGPAAVALVMAEVVGDRGRVIGVERDPSALDAARQVVAQAGATNVELRQGEGTATGLEPGSVDVVVMRHVLAHNAAQEGEIVKHLATLVRPAGSVYLLDIDFPAFRMVDIDPDLEDVNPAYARLHAQQGNDLQPGPRLGGRLRDAGLEVVEHIARYENLVAPPGLRPPAWAARQAMLDAGVVAQQDIDRWDAAFTRTDAATLRPRLFASQYIAIGRRAG
jgi:ubiquinone/menaquinone biosynthesis C-methylase UbiE